MDYTTESQIKQVGYSKNYGIQERLLLPSELFGFHNTETVAEKTKSGRDVFVLLGELSQNPSDSVCPKCAGKMHIHGSYPTCLRHLNFGGKLSCVCFEKTQYYCLVCQHSQMQEIAFKSEKHNITRELEQYVRDLLAFGLTNKAVAEIAGLGKNVVKEIDRKRLQEKYTIDSKKLIQPEQQARFLGIDELKLHNGHKYATVIIDMETSHILWLAHGKKKAVMYGFIDHVGLEWMDGVRPLPAT